MKVEFLNEVLTEAIVTRGWWLWKEQARVSRLVRKVKNKKGKEREEIEWFYTENGDLFYNLDWLGEEKFLEDPLPEKERTKILLERRRANAEVPEPPKAPKVSPWKPIGTKMLGPHEFPIAIVQNSAKSSGRRCSSWRTTEVKKPQNSLKQSYSMPSEGQEKNER